MTDQRPPQTRIVVQTSGEVYAIGPRGGTRWVATLSARDLQTLSWDAKRAAEILRPEIAR